MYCIAEVYRETMALTRCFPIFDKKTLFFQKKLLALEGERFVQGGCPFHSLLYWWVQQTVKRTASLNKPFPLEPIFFFRKKEFFGSPFNYHHNIFIYRILAHLHLQWDVIYVQTLTNNFIVSKCSLFYWEWLFRVPLWGGGDVSEIAIWRPLGLHISISS